ncbi:MAG: BMP family ABC transporter substrate-binding protein [Firmicutes bacterium]|nr:BMP family ABC transporter substrate-binding protein [Bacillota bacterium]
MRYMKKVAAILVLGALVLGVVGCSNSGENKTKSSNSKIAYVITGTLGDEGFFDSGYEGLCRAKDEFNVQEVKSIESFDPVDWEPNLRNAAQAGYDLIFAGGTPMKDYVEKLAPQFPNLHFVLFDGKITGIENVISVEYGEEQGAYVAGVLAALMTTETDIEGINPEKKVGFIGGMDIAVGQNWLNGFKQGVKAIDPEIEVLSAFAGTFGDPGKGKELALAQYEQGADVILHAAGDTGLGVLEAAKVAGRYAIGSDADQDNLQPGHVLTSIMKRVDNSLFNAAEMHYSDKWEGGQSFMYNIENDGVVLTDMSVIGDKVPAEIKAKVQSAIDDIKSGKIKVERIR